MPRCRPFKLIDAMILIGVAALAMAEIRPGWNQFQAFWAGLGRAPTRQASLGLVRINSTIALLNLAVAYGWIRLVQPRMSIPVMVRQPGMLSLVVLIVIAILYLPLSVIAPQIASHNWIVAFALGLSWAAACYRYRASAEPGWIEALGRVFAIGLVVVIGATSP